MVSLAVCARSSAWLLPLVSPTRSAISAKKRGNPNAIIWGIVTFFFTLIGLILYLLIGRNQGTTMGGPPPTGPTGPANPGGPSTTVRY